MGWCIACTRLVCCMYWTGVFCVLGADVKRVLNQFEWSCWFRVSRDQVFTASLVVLDAYQSGDLYREQHFHNIYPMPQYCCVQLCISYFLLRNTKVSATMSPFNYLTGSGSNQSSFRLLQLFPWSIVIATPNHFV